MLEFVNTAKFRSSVSQRKVSIDNQVTGYLNKQGSNASAKTIGQTTMIIFLASMGLAVLSSFGGNSMELMWYLMNTLQILFFISYIHVEYPAILESFFGLLSYANANNQYVSEITFLVFPAEKFNQEQLNDTFGEK